MFIHIILILICI